MRSYEDVAAALSIRLCPGCDFVSDNSHRNGTASDNTIHWTPRRLDRRGLRKFLKVVATDRLHNYQRLSRAMQVYMENAWATKAAAGMRIRFPRSYSHNDRIYIRWLVANGDVISPAARRWAYRKDHK